MNRRGLVLPRVLESGGWSLAVLIVSAMVLGNCGKKEESGRPVAESGRTGGGAGNAPGTVAAGQQLFLNNCSPCHQSEGQGRVGLAPSIRNRDFLAIASDSFITATVMNGRAGTAMIPRPDLAGEKLNSIIRYLRSLPVSNPVSITVDPSKTFHGDPARGRVLFGQFCSSCHGPNGEGYAAGGAGPGIGLKGFLSAACDDYILETVREGRVGTPMRSFLGPMGLVNLRESDIHDVIAFLRKNETRADESIARLATQGTALDPVRGKSIFTANCAPCHQSEGQGKVGLAPSIRNRDFLALASDDFIRHTVLNGRPMTAMVPRPDLKGDLDNIIAYLRSLKVDLPVQRRVDPARLVRGDPARGRDKYATFCSTCHGDKGEGYIAGGSGPGIGLKGFLDTACDDYILQTVKYGRVGTPMRPFLGSAGLANLKESDIGDIIAHLRADQS